MNIIPAPQKKEAISLAQYSTCPKWKRILDFAGSLAALPMLVPLVLVMAIVTHFSGPGPILFRQERVGLNGRRFTMFKFRTMKAGASVEAHKAHALDFIKNNRPMEKMDDLGDSRLIPLGRLLRASGLDELPQILNVMRGEMSLVGPRPCVPYEYEAYLPWQKERFRTIPGLTGLWQVSGKNSLSFEQMIHLDIEYSRKLSFMNDVRIIALTLPTLFGQLKAARLRRTVRTNNTGGSTGSATQRGAQVLLRDARRKLYQFRFLAEDDFDGAIRAERKA